MREDSSFEAAAALRRGSQTLARLEQARDRAPQSAALTAPEWGLLRAFGLNTLHDVRQRMAERAMLAAYDGAPGALTEILIEHVPVSSEPRCVPSRERARIEAGVEEELLETSLDYDPEELRAALRYTVTRRLREHEENGVPQESPTGQFYAVTFGVRDGRVLQREYGTIRQAPVKPWRSMTLREK